MAPGRGVLPYPLTQLLWGLAFWCSATAPMPLATGPQVAVYFVGEPRTLNGTLCSILDNIVQPLLAEKCRLTFFVYTPLGPGVEQYDLLAAVLKVPVVTRVVPRPPRPPPACVANLDRRVRLLNARYNEELLGHIRDMEAVDRERLAYEREHNVQFEWVVFARPDVTYVDPLPPLHSLSPSHLYVPAWHAFDGINDRFAIVPRLYTTPYFHLYSALCIEGLAKSLPSSAFNPERIYGWQLQRSKVPLAVVHDFYFVRTRTYKTHHGHFSGRDLSLLISSRCLSAFQYRCCTVAPRADGAHPTHRGCSKVLHFARRACLKFERSSAREALAAQRYAARLNGTHPSPPATHVN